MNEIDDRIRRARSAVAERDRLRTAHAELVGEIAAQDTRAEALGVALSEEQKDVRRYERGVWAFLYDAFADREARLTKEQREAAIAAAKYREAVAARDELRAQDEAISRRLDARHD